MKITAKVALQPSKTITELVNKGFALKEQAWPVYGRAEGGLDRSLHVSSSEVGDCARKIKFGKTSPNAGKWTGSWGFAERGHAIEAWIVETLRRLGPDAVVELEYIGDEQRSFVAGQQSGTPDGKMRLNGKNYGLEFKSIDPRLKKSSLPKDNHVPQCIQNVDLMEQNLSEDIEGIFLVYFDASDVSNITEFYIDCTQDTVGDMMDQLRDRANAIMDAAGPEDVEPEGLYTGACKTCAFGSECSAAVVKSKSERKENEQRSNAAAAVFGQPQARA